MWSSGVFGNVLEHKGIAEGASGLININNDRTIKTEQLANGAVFEVGGTVYAVAGTDTDPVGLTNTQSTNTPVGRVVEIDPADTQRYVVFRPFIQPAPASGSASDVADLKEAVEEIQANEVKTVALVVDKDAKTAPVTFANATTGLGVGDVIIGVCAQCTTAKADGTMKVTHGTQGTRSPMRWWPPSRMLSHRRRPSQDVSSPRTGSTWCHTMPQTVPSSMSRISRLEGS